MADEAAPILKSPSNLQDPQQQDLGQNGAPQTPLQQRGAALNEKIKQLREINVVADRELQQEEVNQLKQQLHTSQAELQKARDALGSEKQAHAATKKELIQAEDLIAEAELGVEELVKHFQQQLKPKQQ